MTVIKQDNFDAYNVGDSVPGWVTIQGAFKVSNIRPVSGTRSFGSSADGDMVLYTGVSAALDMDVQIDFVVAPGGAIASVQNLMRASADGSSFYGVRLLSTNNAGYNLQALWQTSSGVGPIGDFINNAVSVVAGDTVHLAARIKGNTLTATVWKNGDTKPTTPQISADSTQVTAPGYSGLKNVFNTATVPAYADNFILDDTAPAGSPYGAITNQPDPDGQTVGPITFSTTGVPTSAIATFNADPANPSGITTTVTASLTSGAGSVPATVLAPGDYSLSIALSNTTGTGTVTGTKSISINSFGGNPQTPDPGASSSTVTGVTVSPDGATIQGGATQQFSAVVQGSNGPSQSVTWSLVSGGGSINASSGLYTAPAATTSAQPVTVRARSVQNADVYDDAALTIAAGTAPPVSTVTGVTVTPDGATVQGGATQQFSATVQGTNSPSQSVAWTKTSGPGAVVSGLYSAPAATGVQQIAILRATSQQDASKYDEVQVTIPAASVTPPTYATKIVFGAVPETAGDPVINASGLQYTVWAESTIGALHTIIAQGNTLNIVNGAGQIDITGQQTLLPGDTAYFIWGDAANTMSGRGPVTVS